MTEPSIAQAALARGHGTDWKVRAERAAAAIVAEALPNTAIENYHTLLQLVAIGWLQGVNFGSHLTLTEAERAFTRLKDAL